MKTMRHMFQAVLIAVVIFSAFGNATAQTARSKKSSAISRDPYIGAIVVDARTGRVLVNDNADAQGYPASVIKMMDLLLILDRIEKGTLKMTDVVTISAEAARIGGSQVFLREGETFTIDELLYACMVQSANDAATALALHVAGTKEAFIEMMNEKAKELGMTSTQFNSVHGLPPGAGQTHDTTTPRDLSILARAVLKYPDALRYTSTREQPFRNGTFVMRTHNHLLGSFAGCDGLKTGYIKAGGYTIAATAERQGVRLVAVVMGSTSWQMRDQKTRELLTRGFQLAPPPPPPPPVVTNAPVTNLISATTSEEPVQTTPSSHTWRIILISVGGVVVGIFLGFIVAAILARRARQMNR